MTKQEVIELAVRAGVFDAHHDKNLAELREALLRFADELVWIAAQQRQAKAEKRQ